MHEPRLFIHSSVKAFAGNLTLLDSYVWELYPKIVSKVVGNSKAYSFSPEDELIDVLGFKLATVLRLGKVSSIKVIVKAGSPHSVQIPFVVQEAVEDTKFPLDAVSYYVIEKGALVPVSNAAVRIARHLNEIEDLINSSAAAQDKIKHDKSGRTSKKLSKKQDKK